MKHHDKSIGWRVANRHDIPLWKEYAAIAGCYLTCIGLMTLVFILLAQ
jgi:hypothetical protein